MQESSHTKEDMEVLLGLTSETESKPNICEPFMFNLAPPIGFLSISPLAVLELAL